jgi:hypothetical protein
MPIGARGTRKGPEDVFFTDAGGNVTIIDHIFRVVVVYKVATDTWTKYPPNHEDLEQKE